MLPYLVGPSTLEKRQSPITKKRNSRHSRSANQNSPRKQQRKLSLNLFQKRQRYYLIWSFCVTVLLSVLLHNKFNFLFFIQIFLQLTTRSFTINAMHFTVSNNGTQWILDFGPVSVVLSVTHLDESLTISSLEIPLPAWSLLLSQRQEFLDSHLPRIPITPNQQGTFEMREEVLSSVGAQDTDTGGYELSDLEDIEFSWGDPAVDMDSVNRPGIDTLFSPCIFDDFQRDISTAANPKMVHDEEDKEKSAPTTTTTPESERPTELPK